MACDLSAAPSKRSKRCPYDRKYIVKFHLDGKEKILSLYLPLCRDAPTLFGLDDSLQALISFFRTNKHSRKVLKNG